MIEVTLYEYLNSALDVPVYMEIPAEKDDSFVVLEKTGSSMSNHLYSSMFTAQSYAPSMYEAAALSAEVIDAMLNAVTLADITSVRLNSDYNYTDPGTAQYRYQAVFDIYHY